MVDPELRLLQFADGLFPAGGYAHSFGLETYVDDGRIRDREGLEAFLHGYLEGSVGPCDAAAVGIAVRLGRAHDLAGLFMLDAELEAMRPAPELREASRQMGRQTLRVASALVESDLLAQLAGAADRGATAAHHPLVFGVTGGLLGWSEREAARAYLHATALTVVSAALRLMSLGQLDGQRGLWNAGERISRLASEAVGKEIHDLWSFAPGLEIAAMHHSRLDARLFRS